MARKSSRAPRPSEIVMAEFAGEQVPWDLNKHLNGCLAGYQTNPAYGPAVFFALEALWGIAHDVGVRSKNGKLDPDQLDMDWTISPKINLRVPWIWIRALATAWERYKDQGGSLGHAFGLEGGQGKSPTAHKLEQSLDERAIARWIWSRVQKARAAHEKIRIEDVIQDALSQLKKR